MGCFGSHGARGDGHGDSANNSRRRNKQINKQIQQDKQVYRATHRLLLLGKYLTMCVYRLQAAILVTVFYFKS